MERWCGKVAVVTGASAGIGAAIATKLVEEGIVVAGLARRKARVEELSQKLAGKPGKLHAFECDVTNEESVINVFKEIEETLGPVSILINNAGVTKVNTLVDGNAEMWRQVLDTNILGACLTTKEAIKSMNKNNIDGHVININSMAGHVVFPLPYLNVYPASKFALRAMTDTLRMDLNSMGRRIKTTNLSPGLVETEIFKAAGLDQNAAISAVLEKSPALASKDIADAVAYVLGTPPNVQITELTIRPLGEMM